MAKEKQLDNSAVSETGFGKELADAFVDAYKTIYDAEEKMTEIEKLAISIIPDDFNICDMPEYISKSLDLVAEVITIPTDLISALNHALGTSTKMIITNVGENINNRKDENKKDDVEKNENATDTSTQTNTTDSSTSQESLNIPAESIKYPAMGIILKRYQIIQYRVKIVQLSIQRRLAKLRKKLLLEMLNGKDDAGSELSIPIKQFLLTVGAVANVISTIVGILLTFINSFVILNVDGAGCAFGPTVKNVMMTAKMVIANSNSSTTNTIPEAVDIAITEAESQIALANNELKRAKLLTMASDATSKVANGEEFSPGSFGSLPKFDGATIREAIKIILQMVVDAEALPRYEKLTPINLRFLVFLTTGFEPAAKKTFGIPGFP